jgi:hypothetical protein
MAAVLQFMAHRQANDPGSDHDDVAPHYHASRHA